MSASRLLRTRLDFECEERERLAPFAMRSGASRGRLHPEDEHPYRTAFQRDRDRIVHSRAFRRLEYKTQVFVHREGDHYRNRLTHTLEGGQISRTVARILRLNEELAEAVVLAHDLGHTPFGHAGERVLAGLMRDEGGFDHNRQSLRIVDWLEERDPDYPGLNLTEETREGILKHGCHWEHPVSVPRTRAQPSLEAQVADVADEIAYLNHDIDDGLRSGLLTLSRLDDVRLWGEAHRLAVKRAAAASETVVRAQAVGALINRLVSDLVETTAERLAESCPASVDAVRETSGRLVGFAPETAKDRTELKRFLLQELYNHPHVLETTEQAVAVVGELFATYRDEPALLPANVRERFSRDGDVRAIADYVAGMTDRFAAEEHRRLRGPR